MTAVDRASCLGAVRLFLWQRCIRLACASQGDGSSQAEHLTAPGLLQTVNTALVTCTGAPTGSEHCQG